MDNDISHAVEERLMRIEEHVGLPPMGEDIEEEVEVEERVVDDDE